MRQSLKRPSPSMVVAVIALVMAMVGTATAIRGNSIGADELGKVKLREATEVVDSQVSTDASETAKCKSGEQLLGGGTLFAESTGDEFADIDQSGPRGKRSWFGGGYVDPSETDDFTLVVTAICLKR